MIMAEDFSVNFPVAGLMTRLQELNGYRAFGKDTKTLRFASPKIQACSGAPRSIKQT
jgi:hypothetical protein